MMSIMKDMLEQMRDMQQRNSNQFQDLLYNRNWQQDEQTEEKEESISKVSSSIPKLASARQVDAAIRFGDWIVRAGNVIAEISTSADTWFAQMLLEVIVTYERYMASTPLDKLNIIVALDGPQSNPRWNRTRKRAGNMLLEAIEEEYATYLISHRAVEPIQIIFKLFTIYQPGGLEERAALIRSLEQPKASWNPNEAMQELRDWTRRVRRSQEMKLALPDSTILLKGLDDLMKEVMSKDEKLLFRVSLTRARMELDTQPTHEKVQQFARFLQAEMEALAFKQVETQSTTGKGGPKLQQFQVSTSTYSTTHPAASPTSSPKGSAGEGKGQGAVDRKTLPCKHFASPQGCFRGSSCSFFHEQLKPTDKRCFNCGATEHTKAAECPYKAGKGGKFGGCLLYTSPSPRD